MFSSSCNLLNDNSTVNDWTVWRRKNWKQDYCRFEHYFVLSISAGTNSINLSVDRKNGCQTESSRKLFGNKRSEKTHTHLWCECLCSINVVLCRVMSHNERWTLFLLSIFMLLLLATTHYDTNQRTERPTIGKKLVNLTRRNALWVMWRNDCKFACVTLHNNRIFCLNIYIQMFSLELE